MVAPGHEYQQHTVNVPFATAIPGFVGVAFASVPGGTGLNASSRLFLTDLDYPESTPLAGPIFDRTAHVNDIAASRRTSYWTAAGELHLGTMGMPVLVEVALADAITARPPGFRVGTPVTGVQ